MPELEQRKILFNARNRLQRNGLLTVIQPTPRNPSERGHVQRVYDWLAAHSRGHQKHWLLTSELFAMIEATGLNVEDVRTLNGGACTIEGFYRQRYSLSDADVQAFERAFDWEKGVTLPTTVITARAR